MNKLALSLLSRRTVVLLIALSGLSGVAVGQTPVAQPRGIRHDLGSDDADTAPLPVAQTCTLPEIVDQVPLNQVSGSNLMTVLISVNGTTKQFLLDIALKKPMEVSAKTMAELALPEDPKRTDTIYLRGPFTDPAGQRYPVYDVSHDFGKGALDTRVRVGSLGIGNATGRHLKMLVTKKGEIVHSAPYDGFLTGDFFRQYDIELEHRTIKRVHNLRL